MTGTPHAADLTRWDALALGAAISEGWVTAEEVTLAHLNRIAELDPAIHAFITIDAEGALATARRIDAELAAGQPPRSPLAGVPIAVKDIVVTKGLTTTAGSLSLEKWVPPYDSTLASRLRAADLVILGKTNMDEFAMGSSTENSAFGPTANPWAMNHIPGGSGGGSAAALAAALAPLAIGSDTGGSIRQPAAMTGTVGVKPSYGGVSRYGVIAFASSLEQAGPCARTVADAAALHEIIGGHDPLDSTTLPGRPTGLLDAVRRGQREGLAGLRIGVVEELCGGVRADGSRATAAAGYQPDVLERFAEALALLRDRGADVIDVSCPNFDLALPAYYIIAPSEASSNLARFDGIRYGLRVGGDSNRDSVSLTRAAAFGAEVKRRIILGTYALSAGHFDDFYGNAQRVRTLVIQEFAAAFDRVDLLVSPTAPSTAWPIGELDEDPLAMYLGDLCTIPADLAGTCAVSVPAGLDSSGLPVGLQFMAAAQDERTLYRAAAAFEAAGRGELNAEFPVLPAQAR